jgi:valyl-tRNA synthetase
MMETGYDILFFWVARMIIDGLEFTGQVPFHTVYLHGLIRDEIGRKMSKTYGNVIDPLTVMDELGTDALRFTLLVGSTPGNDMNLSLKKVEANRNFANKVWNAGRFVISAIDSLTPLPLPAPFGGAPRGEGQSGEGTWTLADSWVWARLQQLVRDVERLFQNYQYGEAGRQIYEFFWGDFADWYLEIAKLQLKEGGERAYYTAQTLARVLDLSLRLLHPFTPFVTEELWGHLRSALLDSPLKALAADWPEALIVAPWPEPREEEDWEKDAVEIFSAVVQDTVRAIRNFRAEKKINLEDKLDKVILTSDIHGDKLKEEANVIAGLSGTFPPIIRSHLGKRPADSIAVVSDSGTGIVLPSKGMGLDYGAERTRLEKELAEAQSQIDRLEKLLSSDFAKKAPKEVVQKERDKLATFKEKADKLGSQLASLG